MPEKSAYRPVKLRESDKIFVAGHRGMVGGAVARALRAAGFSNLALAARADLDLTDQRATLDFFDRERPRALVNCAAVVGGVVANRDYPGDFIGANLLLQANLFEAARRFEVEKILFMGSGCVYPRDPPLPTPEEALLTSPLEPTNQWYAVAKIAGVKTGEAYRAQFGMDVVSVMPCNLYGEGDNFDPETSHVAPALVRKFCRAREAGEKQAVVWGSGAALREFLHVDDLARACVFLLREGCPHPIVNVGDQKEISIADLAQIVAAAAGFAGEIVFDRSRPDGAPRKVLDSSKMRALGWRPRIELRAGIARVCEWYRQNAPRARATDPARWRRGGA